MLGFLGDQKGILRRKGSKELLLMKFWVHD